jgi:hypothetical protein
MLALPATEQLLVSGGDARIALDPDSGLNKYGCKPCPDEALMAFGSSTASSISQAGYQAVNLLRERLLRGGDAPEIARQRIKQELLDMVSYPGADLVFAASGTDVHHLAAQLMSVSAPLTVVMVEEDETGGGVSAALAAAGTGNPSSIELLSVPLRAGDGAPRPLADIDADVSVLVSHASRVLLIMVDQSKTGLIAPSPACVADLHRQHPGKVDVLVDACQFRVAPATLRAYLQQGFMVALTGSKFLTGPSFSAALLLPPGFEMSAEFGQRGELIGDIAQLLRWEAALVELRRFLAVPQAGIVLFLQMFARAVGERVMNESCFEQLAVPALDRRPLLANEGWDHLQTIFPILLRHPESGLPLDRGETQQVYRRLQQSDISAGAVAALRYQFGQPVACGVRDGVAVSALRLCISARLISDAAEQKGVSGVINDAMAALDKAAWLVGRLKH